MAKIIGSLELGAGVSISEFSSDDTLAGNSDSAIPTEKAVKGYVDSMGGGSSTIASLPSSGDYSGDTATGTVGENVAIGDVLYFKSDGKFWKADADELATTAGMLVMATGTILADASGTLLVKGLIRYDTWDWTVGAELWVNTTGGNPTATKPSGAGDIIRQVGWAVHADYIWFDPDKTYLEVIV